MLFTPQDWGINLIIYLGIIPILLTFAPWLIARYVFYTAHTRQLAYMPHACYLWIGAALWIVGFFVPNVHFITGTDSFSLHTFGGIVAGVLGLYFIRVYRLHFTAWWQPLLYFYFMASGLGVLNELFEFFLRYSGIVLIDLSDTPFDLVANTTGISIIIGFYYLMWRHRYNYGQ